MKLLAKSAEARYQTARGLEHDLRLCLRQWQAYGRIDPFPLGERDVPDRLIIPEKLCGREDQIARLIAAFDRVLGSDGTEMVSISRQLGLGNAPLSARL